MTAVLRAYRRIRRSAKRYVGADDICLFARGATHEIDDRAEPRDV